MGRQTGGIGVNVSPQPVLAQDVPALLRAGLIEPAEVDQAGRVLSYRFSLRARCLLGQLDPCERAELGFPRDEPATN